MRRITPLFFVLLIVLSANVFGQKKQLTNELIWSSRTFAAENIYAVRSMNDGAHFFGIEK